MDDQNLNPGNQDSADGSAGQADNANFSANSYGQGSAGNSKKKAKTPAQIAREKARRKRRRAKKAALKKEAELLHKRLENEENPNEILKENKENVDLKPLDESALSDFEKVEDNETVLPPVQSFDDLPIEATEAPVFPEPDKSDEKDEVAIPEPVLEPPAQVRPSFVYQYQEQDTPQSIISTQVITPSSTSNQNSDLSEPSSTEENLAETKSEEVPVPVTPDIAEPPVVESSLVDPTPEPFSPLNDNDFQNISEPPQPPEPPTAPPIEPSEESIFQPSEFGPNSPLEDSIKESEKQISEPLLPKEDSIEEYNKSEPEPITPKVEETSAPIFEAEIVDKVPESQPIDEKSHEELAEEERIKNEEKQRVADALKDKLQGKSAAPSNEKPLPSILDKMLKLEPIFKSFFDKLRKINFGILGNLMKRLVIVIVGISLIFGAYMLGAQLKVGDFIFGLFKPKPQEVIVVDIDPENFKKWGIDTAMLFASNSGSVNDYLVNTIVNSYYFGALGEPVFMGQTGISAAIYYGFLFDDKAATAQFVDWIKLLKKLNNLYQINVYDMLDRSSSRDATLKAYLDNLKLNMDEGKKALQEVRIELDDLQISYNSLTPEKDKNEADFFGAMSDLAGEKADFVLKSFVDVSQKQVSLKARINALQKVSQYFDTALSRVAKRIDAIQKNEQPLIQGVRVIEVPGSNIDFVIKAEGT